MAAPMADEYYERYRHLGHRELYGMLRAGSAGDVEAAAGTWRSVGDTVGGLASALRRDLDGLASGWTGPAGREFQYRLGLIVQSAQTLADEADAIQAGLTIMSRALLEAQRQAEPPGTDTRDAAQTFDGFLGAVLGSGLGRVLPSGERDRAQERIAWLVARLAAEYGVADHGNWPATLLDAPSDLPAEGSAGSAGSALLGAPTGPAGPATAGTPMAGGVEPAEAATATGSGTWRGGHVPGHSIGVEGRGSLPVPPTAAGATTPIGPVGMAPIGAAQGQSMNADAAPAGDLAWRSGENMDWADDDGQAAPPVLGD